MTVRLLRCREGPRGQRQRAKRLLAVDRIGIASLNPLMDLGYIAELPVPVRPLVVRAGVELLIGRIVTLGYAPPTRAGRPLTWEAMELVADFIGYVGGATDLAECARVAGCTHYHLVRLFPRFHQSRVQEYIDGCRMEETVRLLRNGWLKKDIAARFGMSPSSFSSWQRRRAGLWPWLGEDEL
jgi:AraC-like DNA-binding protein